MHTAPETIWPLSSLVEPRDPEQGFYFIFILFDSYTGSSFTAMQIF